MGGNGRFAWIWFVSFDPNEGIIQPQVRGFQNGNSKEAEGSFSTSSIVQEFLKKNGFSEVRFWRETDRQTGRQADRQTGRQTDRPREGERERVDTGHPVTWFCSFQATRVSQFSQCPTRCAVDTI